MRDTLDAAAVRRWCAAGLAGLGRDEHEINQLNVYPVPDGDTGTNLVLTLTAAEEAHNCILLLQAIKNGREIHAYAA